MTNDQSNNNKQKPGVTGIGGIFFYSEDPKQTRDWYSKHLGVDMNAWGSASFDSRDIQNPEQINTLQWCPFKTSGAHFAPSKREFMINYRVNNLEALLVNLKESGVTILDDIATYDFGKFVHILDADGNKIELWEPA